MTLWVGARSSNAKSWLRAESMGPYHQVACSQSLGVQVHGEAIREPLTQLGSGCSRTQFVGGIDYYAWS